MSLSRVMLVAMVMVAMVTVTDAVTCYQCNVSSPSCQHPFQGGGVPTCEAAACMKVKGKSGGKILYTYIVPQNRPIEEANYTHTTKSQLRLIFLLIKLKCGFFYSIFIIESFWGAVNMANLS